MLRSIRAFAALVICACVLSAPPASAGNSAVYWGIDRTATPNEIAVKSADGSQWFKIFKLTAVGQPTPYFANTFCGASEWITATAGVPACSQPAFSNISGQSTLAQLPTLATVTLLGNPTGAGATPVEITLGATLSFSGISLRTGAGIGDVTWSENSFATTIANNAVSNAKLAQMAQGFSGRATVGTGNREDLTPTQATALLDPCVGDSGSGGKKGMVPAPAAGDAAAGKVLGANCAWVAQARADITDYISSIVPVGSAVSLTSNVVSNITSISLPAGNWLCGGYVITNPNASTTQTINTAQITTTSGTFNPEPNGGMSGGVAGYTAAAGIPIKYPVGTGRIVAATTTTIYLVTLSTFAVSTNSAYGSLWCMRIK